MSSLGLPVERPDAPVSADCWLGTDVFAEWLHNQDVADSRRMLVMFALSIGDEKERRQAALSRHDHAAADECLGEIRDLTMYAAMCRAKLDSVSSGAL